MSYKLEPISKPVLFGHYPLWDNRRGQLVFTDCFGRSVNIFDPTSQEITAKEVKLPNEEINFISSSMPYVSSTSKFLIPLSTGKLVEYDWDLEKVTRELFNLDNPLMNFEDSKCDAKGRYWTASATFDDIGTLAAVPNAGKLYKLCESRDGTLECATEAEHINFDVPIGLAFNKEQNKLFWNDLTKRVINVFEFDIEQGKLGNHKTFFDYKNHPELDESLPDGLCIDIMGNPWVACWKGGSVIKVDGQTGKLLDKILLPVTNVTSACFGGTNHHLMYVTTTSIELDKSPVKGEPEAGKLLLISHPRDNSFKGFQETFLDM